MDHPPLRHFREGQIFSDIVEILNAKTWVQAVYSTDGWHTLDGSRIDSVTRWRHARKAVESSEEGGQSTARVQGRYAAKRQTRTRKRAKSQEP